jgi:hypothetical protein
MARGYSAPFGGRVATDTAKDRERLPLRWADPVVVGLALLGWAVVLIPVVLLLRL